VAASRVQNIVITLDKVKHVLRQQPAEVADKPLMRLLDDQEVGGRGGLGLGGMHAGPRLPLATPE
jgi:hypothetical protein